MSSLRLALKQSLEVASAEGVVIPKKINKTDRAMSKHARSRSIDDGSKSDSSEENEASLHDLQDESGSGSSEEEVGEIVGTPEKSGSGSKTLQLNTAAHKIQSQFRKKKDKKPEGSGATKTRTKKTSKQRRSSAVSSAERQTLDGADQPDEGDYGSSSEESETWTVAPPSEAVIKHMMSLSIDTSRRMMTPGLRVKVHFDRSAWYGGWVSDVNKDGSKIRIRYDDGNTEVTSFPDLSNTGSVDIVVDAVQNGQHAETAIEAASVFLPLSDAVTRPAPPAPPSAAIDGLDGTVPLVSEAVHRENPSQSTSEMGKLDTSLAERLIAKSDSREEGELLEPYVAPIRLTLGDGTPLEQPGVPSEEKTLSSSQELLAANSVPKADDGESSVADRRLANLLSNCEEAELGREINADSLMRDLEAVADDTPKPKRKRGRPPKQRPSDATDVVEAEESVPMDGETSSFATNEPKVGSLDEGNATAVAAAAAPVEPVRIIPSLKIRMPKSSGDGGSKSLKSPRTPRSPTATFEHMNDEASLLQSDAKSGPLDVPQRKRPLASDSADHPPPKKLSIRIPIHKVKSTLQDATLRSPKVEQSVSILERKVVEEIHPRNQASPRSQPSSVIEPDHKEGHGGQQVSMAPSIKSSAKSSPVSMADQQSPLSPKLIKKLKKRKLLLSSGGTSERKKGDLDQLERGIAQSAASGESASNETFGESMDTSTGYHLDRAGNDPAVAEAAQSAKSSDEAQTSGTIYEDFGKLDFSLDGPIRSERRAAQQANERIATKQEVALPVQSTGKKKKKRDRQKEMEGGVPRTGAEEFEGELDDRWAQCDACGKWRVIPSDVVQHLPKQWYCSDNTYDPKRASCDAPEQTPKEVAKEKKKRMKKRQRMMKAAEAQEAAEGSSTPKLDEKGLEPPVRKEKPLDQVKSPRPARESQEGKEKPPRPPKRSSPVDEIQARDTISDGRPRKEKKVPVVGKKVRAVEPAEKAPEEELVPVDVVKPRGRGRPRRNQGKESISGVCQPIIEGEGDAGDAATVGWVQCELCDKWRKLPPHISADILPEVWTCNLNDWNPGAASCEAPEDKAEGLQDIGVFGSSGASAGKLTYRHLIFGSTGRKANRPISERVRAAESLFATQFDEDDAPSKVLYADSSVYISRGRSNNTSEDNVGMSMLELMSHSHLWRELRGANQATGNGLLNSQVNMNAYTFDTLPLDVQRAMKDYMLHVLDVGTFSGDDIVNLAKQPAVDSLPEALRKARMYCTENVVITTLCQLVKEGKVDCIQKITNTWPIREWNPLYRRAMKRVPPPVVAQTSKPRKTTPRVSRFMKISKPWKHANADKGYEAIGDTVIKSSS
jgi:CW-type Zinc Finger